MMKQSIKKIYAIVLALTFAAAALSACTTESTADWEDTLPSAVTTTAEKTVVVIEEDTKPPISISMPETTTTTERKTELATSLKTETEEEDELPSETQTVTGIPSVPAADLTSTVTTVPTTVTASVPTETTSVSSESTVVESSAVSTLDSSGTSDSSSSAEASDGLNSRGEKIYIFNDPISRPYCYSFLSDNLKAAYDVMIEAIQNHESDVKFPDDVKITSQEYCDLYQMIYDNEHSVFYIGTQMKYTTKVSTKTVSGAELDYIYTTDEVAAMQEKIDAAANEIISEIAEDMSEYEIVKLFFDKLAGEVVYDESASNLRDIYGSLVNHAAVCGGYAKAFSYLCDKVGIESLTITGDFDEVPHMWNMVKLDGEWYHVDATAGYVKNPVVPYIRYDYFCVTDALIANSRTVYEQSYSYPVASADKYNYYVYNNLVADSTESVEKLLLEGIAAATANGDGVIQIACSDDTVFDEVVYWLFDKSQANALDIYDKAYSSAEKKYNCESIVYNQEKATRVIKLFLEYLD